MSEALTDQAPVAGGIAPEPTIGSHLETSISALETQIASAKATFEQSQAADVAQLARLKTLSTSLPEEIKNWFKSEWAKLFG